MKENRKQKRLTDFRASIDKNRYFLDAIASYERPLPRVDVDLGYIKLPTFALPGYEKEFDRYILSQTGVAAAIDEDELTARRYFKKFNPQKFRVEGSKRMINGIPIVIAADYWIDRTMAGNKNARALVRAFGIRAIQFEADLRLDIKRPKEKQQRSLIRLIEYSREIEEQYTKIETETG